MNVDEVRQRLSKLAQPNGTAFAKSNSLSPSYVNEVIKGTREPGEKILTALGLERVVSYRRKEK